MPRFRYTLASAVRALSLLALFSCALWDARPAAAQVRVLWDTLVDLPGQGGVNVRVVQTSSDGTVSVGGNLNGAHVSRLSASGAVLWTTPLTSYGTSTNSLITIGVGPAGQVYALTQFGNSSSPTGADVAVHRVNADGTVAWSHPYDGPNGGNVFREIDRAVDLAVDAQGNVFTTSQTGFADNESYTWSQKHSPGGTLLWDRTFNYGLNGHAFPRPTRAAVDCAGNVYVSGFMNSRSNNKGIPGFFVSYAPDGTLRQEAILSPPAGETIAASHLYLHEVRVDCSGTAYVAGVQNVADTQAGASQVAFVARFDTGSSVPAWTRFPFSGQSGSGNSATDGVSNLAVGGPDAIYASAESDPAPGAARRVETVRLRADGTTAWRDPGVAGESTARPIAADGTGVVVLTQSSVAGSAGYTYRQFSPVGALMWEIRRTRGGGGENAPLNNMAAMAMHPQGGVVWVETFGHVVRAADPVPQARVFVVHASAMLSLFGPIDVYLNQSPTSTTPDATMSFPSGTRLLNVPAGQAVTVRARLVNPPPSGLPREVTFTTPPLAGGDHLVSLAGILPQLLGLYADNPNGISRELRLIISFLGNLAVPDAPPGLGGNVAVVVTNAVTDAPAIDVVVAGTGQILADDLLYGQSAPTATMTPGTYRVEVRRASTGALLEAVRFTLDGTEGVFALAATGFLTPSANQNGPALTLSAVDSTGTVQPGVVVTGAGEAPVAGLSLTVANPTRGSSAIRFAVPTAGPTRLVVVDALGREIAVLVDGERAAGAYTATLPSTLAPGAYVVRLRTAAGTVTRLATIVR